jgi:hypothetical protein
VGTSETSTAASGTPRITPTAAPNGGVNGPSDQSLPATSSPETSGRLSQKAPAPNTVPTEAAAPDSTAATSLVPAGDTPSRRSPASRRSLSDADSRVAVATSTVTGMVIASITATSRRRLSGAMVVR